MATSRSQVPADRCWPDSPSSASRMSSLAQSGSQSASVPSCSGGRVTTAKCASSKSLRGSRHSPTSWKASRPTTNTGRRGAVRSAIALSVSTRKDGPPRSTSMGSTSKCGLSSIASRTQASLSSAGAIVSIPCSVLWGGRALGTKSMRSRPSTSTISSAARRCPTWIGLKVPPKTPKAPVALGEGIVIRGAGRLRTGQTFES